ncbi:hypothetical protein PG997_012201 [Apiospora hydei]|uniref:Uncharacterized protein n=1 Tax=Apiospora hydei TaxID=1337664 RepID=A0ABR1V2P2_9PEZI
MIPCTSLCTGPDTAILSRVCRLEHSLERTSPLSMARKIRKDNNNGGNSGLLRPYPLAAALQTGSSVGSTPMGSEAATISDDSQAEGDLHPFQVAPKLDKKQKQKKMQQPQQLQAQQATTTSGRHHVPHITAAALPSKVFNGEAWLLDPYGTGEQPAFGVGFSEQRDHGGWKRSQPGTRHCWKGEAAYGGRYAGSVRRDGHEPCGPGVPGVGRGYRVAGAARSCAGSVGIAGGG